MNSELNISSSRFIALDVFRGLTVCFMIIVNTPGNWAAVFCPLKHADWNGFTPTDLVFPSFLFAVGNALSFAMRRWNNMSQLAVLFKIFKRVFLIFIIGYLMSWFPFFKLNEYSQFVLSPISQTRIMGVLQRIAFCYGIVALMIYYLGHKKTLLIGVLSLLAYWVILFIFGESGAEYSKTGNAVLSLDMCLLGSNHLYGGEGFLFDPEGVLSTLPALFNVIGGYAIGHFIQKQGKSYEGLTKLLFVGVILIFIAYCWNPLFPINKKLWTSSYAMLTVGLDCLILSIIIYLLDFSAKTRDGYFFLVLGRNPLFIYVLAELGAVIMYLIPISDTSLFSWIYSTVFIHTGTYLGSFLFACWWMFICWFVGYILDKKKIYIKI